MAAPRGKAAGATLMTNTQLVDSVLGTQRNAGTTFYAAAASATPWDVRPTPASPVMDFGAALSAEYKYDLLGIDQTQFGPGWEIGSLAFVPASPGRVKAGP